MSCTHKGLSPERRAFIRAENQRLGRFLDPAGPDLAAWHRSYRCPCGFKTTNPGTIFDHTKDCHEPDVSSTPR